MNQKDRFLRSLIFVVCALALAASVVMLASLLRPVAARAQWICPPARVNDPSDTLYEWHVPKPALFAPFYDSVYATCFTRITDSTDYGDDHTVPTYSQLQAWNKSQTLLLLAGGQVLTSPSFVYWKTVPSYVAGGGMRWNPVNDSLLYYIRGDTLKSYNVYTDTPVTVHTFTEYAAGGLEVQNAQEDISRDGRIIAMQGYLTAAMANDSSHIFCYDLIAGRKSHTITGVSTGGCSGADVVGVSPSGKYVVVDWGSGGTSDTLTCGTVCYDTSMVYQGKLSCGHDHYDLTQDADGTEWQVKFANGNSDCGLTGNWIVKSKLPNGFNRWYQDGSPSGGNDSTYTRMLPFVSTGGGHISGRAFDTGWVIMSADQGNTTDWAPFSNEIVKLYLDSTPTTPHVERLANARSYPGWIGSNPTLICPNLSPYWAQPHATPSRDGTRIIWGSSWDSTCAVESYVMNINRNGFNDSLVNQTANTWKRLSPTVYKANGTGGGVADTLWPKPPYGDVAFAPEWGSIVNFGGGGHGARRGNDVWLYDSMRNRWVQQYEPDSINVHQYPQDGYTDGPTGYSMRSYDRGPYVYAGGTETNVLNPPTALRPWGMTANGRPWSSHAYQQMCWDSRNRVFRYYGPNYHFGVPADSSATVADQYWYFGVKASMAYDPWTKTWAYTDTLPDLYVQRGTGVYDPVHLKFVATNYDTWHSSGGTAINGTRTMAMDSLGVWSRVANPPSYGYADLDYQFSRHLGKIIGWDGRAADDTLIQTYDAGTNTWSTLNPNGDATYGKPPRPGADYRAGARSAYSLKDEALLMHGRGDYPSSYSLPTWVYYTKTNTWAKMNPPAEPKEGDFGALAYDPTNNVFFMLMDNGHTGDIGSGPLNGPSGGDATGPIFGSEGELWSYKLSAGSGAGGYITVGAPSAPASSCGSPGGF